MKKIILMAPVFFAFSLHGSQSQVEGQPALPAMQRNSDVRVLLASSPKTSAFVAQAQLNQRNVSAPNNQQNAPPAPIKKEKSEVKISVAASPKVVAIIAYNQQNLQANSNQGKRYTCNLCCCTYAHSPEYSWWDFWCCDWVCPKLCSKR